MMEMLKPLPKLGMPVHQMLIHAIHKHCMQHYGERPRRFEIHPAIYAEFMCGLDDPWMYVMIRGRDQPTFHDVEIVVDPLAVRPKMITADNMVEYL